MQRIVTASFANEEDAALLLASTLLPFVVIQQCQCILLIIQQYLQNDQLVLQLQVHFKLWKTKTYALKKSSNLFIDPWIDSLLKMALSYFLGLIHSIISELITPAQQALKKFTCCKFKGMDTWDNWVAGERKKLNWSIQ